MRFVLVGGGASWSIADVEDGVRAGLRANGHEVIDYSLQGRLPMFGWMLHRAWKHRRKDAPEMVRPTSADVFYMAGQGVLEKALRHMPDWVLIVSGMYLMPDLVILLRRAGMRVAVLLTESPYDAEPEMRYLQHVDAAFTNERSCVAEYRRSNPNTYYLPHAFDPERHRPHVPADDDVPAHDVVFVGTMFQERVETLAAVDWDALGLDLGLYGSFDLLGPRHRLRRYVRGSITPNAKAAALYRRAKVGLNLYRTSIGFGKAAPRIAHAESLNPRALELAASGCFTVSDDRLEVAEVFGELVPTFRNPDELSGLLRFWCAEDERRRHVAMRLPAAVSGHDFATRARQIADTLASLGTREPVPV